MRSATPKRQRETRQYMKLRAQFLGAQPPCVRCGGIATEIHHRRGRRGALLLTVEFWSPLCHRCHHWVTVNPAAAAAAGLSESRIGRTA